MNYTKIEWLAEWLSLGVGWPALFWARTAPEPAPATQAPAVSPESQGTAS
jgi:hypothetical protein